MEKIDLDLPVELIDGTEVEVESSSQHHICVRRKDGKTILPEQYAGYGLLAGYEVVYVDLDGSVTKHGDEDIKIQIIRNKIDSVDVLNILNSFKF